ncbi:MAG: DNA-3-methyladenine glycosylase I [Bacteroidetes bacterium]|nr:DNA-3-methyladenine glycosylase I [Bacteroidota bacterium]
MKPNDLPRCPWCLSGNEMIDYHDKEWGMPAHDDRTHFEFLILEAAQAGLSWLTVLKRREGYRKAFADFDFKKVAKFTESDVKKLMQDTGIIRNQLKIRSAISNAVPFIEIQKEFGSFDSYLWNFVKGKPLQNKVRSKKDLIPNSPLSDVVSKDLKKRGFRFVGTTVIYSHLQAVGIVNDHEVKCFRRTQCASKNSKYTR